MEYSVCRICKTNFTTNESCMCDQCERKIKVGLQRFQKEHPSKSARIRFYESVSRRLPWIHINDRRMYVNYLNYRAEVSNGGAGNCFYSISMNGITISSRHNIGTFSSCKAYALLALAKKAMKKPTELAREIKEEC